MRRRYRDDELYHFGIKGMKWGVRRYQNKDGSYTSAGLKRHNASMGGSSGSGGRSGMSAERKAKIKKAAKIAAGVAGAAALAYGGYRFAKSGTGQKLIGDAKSKYGSLVKKGEEVMAARKNDRAFKAGLKDISRAAKSDARKAKFNSLVKKGEETLAARKAANRQKSEWKAYDKNIKNLTRAADKHARKVKFNNLVKKGEETLAARKKNKALNSAFKEYNRSIKGNTGLRNKMMTATGTLRSAKNVIGSSVKGNTGLRNKAMAATGHLRSAKNVIGSSIKSTNALKRGAKVAAGAAAAYGAGRLGMMGVTKAQKAVWAKQGYNPTANKSNKATTSAKTTGTSRREIKKAAKAQYKSDMAKIKAEARKFDNTYNSKAAADRKWARSAEADKMLGDWITKNQSDIKAAKARYKEAKRRR